MHDLVAEAVGQPLDHDGKFAVEPGRNVVRLALRLGDQFLGAVVRVDVRRHQFHPISVKNTAKKASSTMTMKIACTTASVVRRPTSSALPDTCMPW